MCMQLYIIIIALGSNAIVSYVVLGVSPPGQMTFTINSSTGVMTKNFALDREIIDQYILTIQVILCSTVYMSIAEKILGVQLSRTGFLYHFLGLIFADVCNCAHYNNTCTIMQVRLVNYP